MSGLTQTSQPRTPASSRRSSPAPEATMGKTVTTTDLLRAGRRDNSNTVPKSHSERLDDSVTRRLDVPPSSQLDVGASQPPVAESLTPEGDQTTRWLGVQTS